MNELWKSYNDNSISIQDFLIKNDKKDYENIIMIGTDSQTTKKTRYTTAIVFYHKGKGATAIHKTILERKPHNLHEQLLKETYFSITAALEVMEIDPKYKPNILQIHLDVNNNPKYESARYKKELMGMVIAQGFKCLIKPDSWVSSHLADRIVRQSNIRVPRRK